MRAAIMTVVLLAMTGCQAAPPLLVQEAPRQPFESKLLNLFSLGSQTLSQTNLMPNSQANLSGQSVATNTTALFPIASAVGTGAAAATNLTGQDITNNIDQCQCQNQIVL